MNSMKSGTKKSVLFFSWKISTAEINKQNDKITDQILLKVAENMLTVYRN